MCDGSNDGAIYKGMRVAEMLSTLAHLELFCYVKEKSHENLHAICALQQLEVDHEEEERMLAVEEGALAAYHSRAGTYRPLSLIVDCLLLSYYCTCCYDECTNTTFSLCSF